MVRLVQVLGVHEAVPDNVTVGDEACLPASTSPIARASIYLQDILSFMALIADSLLGYCQVRHVDAAVGQPASGHECEKDLQVWEYESGSSRSGESSNMQCQYIYSIQSHNS